MENNGYNLVNIPVSVSGLDLFLKYGKILPPPVSLRLGSIVEAHGRELKTEYDRGRIDTSPSPLFNQHGREKAMGTRLLNHCVLKSLIQL